jgi:hypothetical protein
MPMTAPSQSVRLRTAAGCSLAIGAYPRFHYDARGGGGDGLRLASDPQGRCGLQFAPEQLSIPPLNWRTGRLLGLPLLPGIEVRIVPQRLEGWMEPATGAVQLHFQANFVFRAGRLYEAPPLWVDTLLTSATPAAPVPSRWGEPAGEARGLDGGLRLVGVAPVAPSGDRWFDRFLGLPSEALAELRCTLTWEG